MNFSDLEFTITEMNCQAIVNFPNGYGASVIIGEHTYGGRDGLYELAVLKDGRLTYETPITDDVVGYCTEDDITELLQKIEEL